MHDEQSSPTTRTTSQGEAEKSDAGAAGSAPSANAKSASQQMEIETQRFNSKVNKNGPVIRQELGPCWMWTGAFGPRGYGRVRFAGGTRVASRTAFFLANMRWPTPCCLHECDNPPCVNPAHLHEGTRTQNMAEMKQRGRYGPHRGKRISAAVPKGERHYLAKLNVTTVQRLRREYSEGRPVRVMAEELQMEKNYIRRVVKRLTWKHVQ